MVEVTIRRLGHKGHGIADGPVFVPMALPGEVVSGDLEGDILTHPKILSPSSDRVSPPCPHFKSCGGCQLQHASDAFLETWKADIVHVALTAQGLSAVFLPIHVSPAFSRRRASFAVRRTKKGALAGFHARASDVIVEIPGCTLLHPDLMAGRSMAEAIALIGVSRKAALAVMVTRAHGAGLDVSVKGGKALDGPMRMSLAAIAETHDIARLNWDDETIVMRHPPEQRFGDARVVPPPGAFLQATADGQARLLEDVQEITAQSSRIVDLFAGCGTFALPLAARCMVHAVEGDSAMVAALDLGWRRAEGLRAVSTQVRDLFRRPLEPDELSQFDAAVIDPPRAGAEAQVRTLATSKIPTIAYVSCNPVSFSRDARILVDAGFTLNHLRVVDQFRWSAHVELVAKFTR